MFNFHGGSGHANDFINTNDMRPIADTAGFIAVYPQGAIDYDGGGSTSWIHKAPTDHDDIFFVEAIIDALSLEYPLIKVVFMRVAIQREQFSHMNSDVA